MVRIASAKLPRADIHPASRKQPQSTQRRPSPGPRGSIGQAMLKLTGSSLTNLSKKRLKCVDSGLPADALLLRGLSQPAPIGNTEHLEGGYASTPHLARWIQLSPVI